MGRVLGIGHWSNLKEGNQHQSPPDTLDSFLSLLGRIWYLFCTIYFDPSLLKAPFTGFHTTTKTNS